MTDYTSILHLPQVGSNQEQKEATINTAIAILEASANDMLSLSLAAGDITLNTDQFTKYFLHQFTGHTVARQVTIPATPRWFAVENKGTAPIVFKVAGATGLTVELPANRIGLVVADGANIRFVVPDPISGMGLLRDLSDVDGLPVDGQLLRYDATAAQWKPWTWTAAFTQLSDTPSSLGGSAGKLVAVNAAGNRLEFITSAANINSFVDLDDTPNSYSGAANRHVVVNAAGNGLTFARPYLRENSDFPSSYNTHANKFLRVNAAADGVVFGNPQLADLTDGPGAPTINEALLYVRVNAAGTGWEYVTGTGGPVNFTELHDTPSNFTGQKGKLVRVGQDEDQLIFADLKLVELSDTPNAYTDAAGKILKVNSAQSGVVFGTLKVEELSDGPGPMAAAQRGMYVRVNATNNALEYVKPALSELSGVPSFAGQGGKFIRVNDSETGLDFAVNALDMAFIGLSDTPANYSNSQNKFVAVNPQGTGLIFVNAPSGGGSGGGPYSLDQITDVDAPDPAAGQVLTFRDGWWRPETPTGGVIGVTALSELTDVNFTLKSPEEGDVLTFESGFWVAKPANATPIPQGLDDLTDVDLSEGVLANGEVLTYWDGKWIHAPVQVPSGDGLRFGEHRDWRLFFRTADTPALEIAEFVLRAGAGLPQLAQGGTPAASSDAGATFTPDMAFDGDAATFWRSGAAGADRSWLRYTFAEPQEINHVSLTFGALRQLPITWALQFSDDGGLTWITAWSESRAFGWTAGETVETAPTRAKLAFAMLSDSPGSMTAHPGKFLRVDEDGVKLDYVELPIPATSLEELTDVQITAPPAEDQVLTFKDGIWQPKDPASTVTPELALNDLTDVDTAGQQEGDLLGLRGGRWVSLSSPIDYGRHAYWRVVVDDTAAYPGTTTVVVAEVVMRDEPGGPQRATGGVAIGTGGNINGAFDGTVGDAWTAYLPDAWIGYTFPTPVALQEVALTASAVAGWAPNYSPEAFRVQYSDDGSTWFTAWTVTGQTSWTASQTRVYTRPGLTTRFLDNVDTPDSYVGQSGKLVHVKADESGLEFVDKPAVPEGLGDLGDVDVVTTPPGEDSVLIYYPQNDLPGVWRPGMLHLDMLTDVHVPYNPVVGQVLTWVDTGVEGGGRWEARTPENGGGPGTEYPIAITDGRWIASGAGAPDWADPSGSLYMRHDPGDLYVSRATTRLAPRVVQGFGRVVENSGAVTWAFPNDAAAGNWLILLYASGSNGAVTMASGWTTVVQGAGTDMSVTIAYRKVLGGETWPLAITTQSGPEDAYAIYEVSGLGENWVDFYQASQAVGSTAGTFAPTAYVAPATSPYTFALAAMFQLGGTAPVGMNGEFFNEPLNDGTGTLSMAATTTYALEPTTDMTVTGALGAGAAQWAYGVLYLNAARQYGDNLEPAWNRFLIEGEGGATTLDELTDVDLTTPPTSGQALVYRDGAWKPEDVEGGSGLNPDRQQVALLIVNPGAEDGVSGWTATAGAFTSVTSAGSLGAPVEGTHIFRATQNTSPCEMTQTIAIDSALQDYIDVGRGSVEVSFSYGRVNNDGSTALVTLEALDGTGALIDSTASQAYTTTTTWQVGKVSHTLPALTRSVRVVVRSTRTGTFNYGAFDAFSGSIKIASAHPALADLRDVGPWTSSPTPGQALIYRDGAWQHENLPEAEIRFGAHAYWRVIFHNTTTAGWISAKELVFRAAAGEPQLATGGTPSASSAWPGNGAALAFDDNPATYWQNNGDNDGAWIRYAFAAPVEVNHVTLTVNGQRPNPTTLSVQYSDDGVTWITAWSQTHATIAADATLEMAATATKKQAFAKLSDGPGALTGQAGKLVAVDPYGVALTYVPPVNRLNDLSDVTMDPSDGLVLAYRNGFWRADIAPVTPHLSYGVHSRWRIYFRTPVSDYITVREATMSKVMGGPQLAIGGTATASSSRNTTTYDPSKAFDGTTSYWQSSFNANTGTWLAYAFAEPVEIGHVTMVTDSSRAGPISWDVQYSDDGVTWTTAYSGGTETGWTTATIYQIGSRDRIAFNRLIDTPDSYVGQGGKVVGVRQDGQGLEFLPYGDALRIPTHRGVFGVTSGYVTYDFEGTPPDRFADAYTAGWTAYSTTADPPYTKALKSPIIGHNQTTQFTFTVDATSTEPDLTFRYLVSSENPDKFSVLVDGVEVLSDSGPGNPYKTFTTQLAAGTRVITVRYAKDGSYIQGNDDVRISYIRCNGVYSAEPYLAGDTVSHDGSLYLCLVTDTVQTPGTGTDWRLLPAALDDLTDIDLTVAPVQDYVLTFDSGRWIAKELPASSGGTVYMTDLGDVEMPVGGPDAGDVLRYQDGKWRPTEASSLDNLYLNKAMVGSGEGAPTTPRPSGSLYIDEITGQIAQSLKDVPTVAPAPTIVQHILSDAYNSATTAQPVSATLPAPPTAGNWLVALLCDQTLATAGSGWTLLPGSPVSGSIRVRPSVAYKQAGVSETASQTPFISGGGQIGAGAMVIYEIAGMTTWSESFQGVVWEDDTTYTVASGQSRAPLTARALHDGLGLGLYVTRPDTSTLTPDSPWTTLTSGVTEWGGGNRIYVAASAVAAAGTSIAPKATFAGATEAGYVTILLDHGPTVFEEGWRRFTGNIALDDLTDVTSTAPSNGAVLTYRDGVWSPEAAEGEFSGTGAPIATAPLGKVYQRRDGVGEAWVSTLVVTESEVSTAYTATGVRQSLTVGAGISSLTFKLWGGAGGAGHYSSGAGNPGAGGYTLAHIPVSEGDLIELDVGQGGGGGHRYTTAGAGGWPDGGDGTMGDASGGGGGGSSRVWRNGNLMAVAGGGGGGSAYGTDAGAGGGLNGQNSANSSGGTGGTQTAGGVDASNPIAVAKQGGYLQGGKGGDADRVTSTSDDGGGGGGGYYGGGGGGGDGHTGGGGSGYLNATAGVTGMIVSGDRQVPPNQSDPDYVAGVAVGPTSIGTGSTGPAPVGGSGLIVLVAPTLVQGWRRLATSDDLQPLHDKDLLKVTTYTVADQVLTAQDRQGFLKVTDTIDRTITVPTHSAVPFKIGTSISFQRGGEGAVTVLAASGVTLEYPADMAPRLRIKNSVASIVQTEPDVWTLFGDLEPLA